MVAIAGDHLSPVRRGACRGRELGRRDRRGLPSIIAGLRARGLEPVGLPELVN